MKQSFFSTEPNYQVYTYKKLKGRFGHWPAQSADARRTFVLVYGQHATLERVEPIAKALTEYGDVYAVDTPGFGGMDASYKASEYPSLAFFSGHLKHFVNEYIPADRQLTYLGISYGFQIITTMLAEHAEIAENTEQAISFVGFVNYTDFSMPAFYKGFYAVAALGRTHLGSKVLKAAIRPWLVRFIYLLVRPSNAKFKSLSKKEAKYYVGEQIWLWMVNDYRTHAATAWDFWFKNDLRQLRVAADAIHIGVPRDHLLKNHQVSSELQEMFRTVEILDLNLANHAPIDVDTPAKVSKLLPGPLKIVLQSSRNKTAVTV